MKHRNLAIFIPHAGCKNRCSFCDQSRISGQTVPPTPKQVETILKDCVNSPSHRAALTQIAFFGGSFTCIPTSQMISYLEVSEPFIRNGDFTGIRISTRPDGITREILTLLKRYHVESIELGAQSMSKEVLQAARRGHTPEDTVRAAELIHEYAFDLGLQMLIGLPEDSKIRAMETAQALAKLSPKEMRLYPAVVFPNTQLYDQYKNGQYHPLSIEEALEWTVPIAHYLQNQGIRLLKVGLHQADGAVAGAFHPAFGEMVRTGLWNIRLKSLLPPSPAKITVRVKPQELSVALGQKRSNLEFWKKQGYELTITTSDVEDTIEI